MARAKDSVRIVHPSSEMAGGGSNALPEWCQTFKMRGEVKSSPMIFMTEAQSHFKVGRLS